MIVLDVGDLAPSRNHWRIAFVDFYRRTAIGGHGPYRSERLYRRGIWIGRQVSFRGPVGVMIAAQHEHEARAVRRKSKLRDFLPVVIVILRRLARRKVRSARHPNVAHAIKIAHPRDHIAMFGCRKFGGEWIMQHLRHGVPGARAGRSGQRCERNDR